MQLYIKIKYMLCDCVLVYFDLLFEKNILKTFM